ncbi:nitrate- and nitrite sensing domain-containing protein [Streptomyces sodiiphilus]|uniref:nitrate- and nitrite sensing domain-containing protein n=1 Tax=Streptomyces sodiiphilus TaxID=226217 RepID=UPI0031D5F511
MRNRLLVSVALTATAVLSAGAPAVLGSADDLRRSQHLLEDAELARQAVSLSHILADERDALVVALASGDPAAPGAALDDSALARADRRAGQLRPEAGAGVREQLDALPAIREAALSGESTPAETHAAYTAVIEALDGIGRTVARVRPGRAADATADALPDLARAVEASSATRALLLAALAQEDGTELHRLARTSHARETAALADFSATAHPEGRERYGSAVTGPDVDAAEDALLHLLLQPSPAAAGQDTDPGRGTVPGQEVLPGQDAAPGEDSAGQPAPDTQEAGAALAARTELQRGVLASLSTAQVQALEQLRDDDLTALQLRIALVAAALLLGVGVSVHTARSLTRPLAAVRLGSRRVAQDPAGQEPVRYTGRNDEFAEVVASVNALHARAVTLEERAFEAGGLREERDRLAAEREQLLRECRDLTGRLADLHDAVHSAFAHHAQRTLSLVGEQMAVLGRLEERETDPDRLAVLFTLDHLSARVRRHAENVLLLAGAERATRSGEPVELIDVLRAAVSEIEHYELVDLVPPLPEVAISGAVARDVGHLMAELLDNATAFSPAGAQVRVTARRGADGGLTLAVEDDGIGMAEGRIAELNDRLASPANLSPPGLDGDPVMGMGLYTVARLADRHGLRAALSARQRGGITAEVTLPRALVEELPGAGALPPPPPGAAAVEAGGPAEHGRAAEGPAEPGTGHIATASAGRGDALPAQRAAEVDPDELRNRLGGFQRGARQGHRDAARPAAPPAGEELPS